MKTIDVQKDSLSLEQVLTIAATESVLLVAGDGKNYILEEADEFDQEVEKLGNSDRFIGFLQERAKEDATIPIENIVETSKTKSA